MGKRKSRGKRLIFFLILLCLLMMMSYSMMVSTPASVSILTANTAISPPSSDMRTVYNAAANAWIKTIKWEDPITGNMQTGLTDDLVEQVKERQVGLSPGLLLGLAELGGRYSEENAKEMADLLSPRDLVVKAFEESETTEVSGTDANGQEAAQPPSKASHTVLRIEKIRTYNGAYTFQYESRTSSSTSESNGQKVTVTSTKIYYAGETLDKDDSPLVEAMDKSGLHGTEDRKILYRQALALDTSFNDPAALDQLPDVDGGGDGGFTGYSNGPYSMNTVVTEDSGVTLEQIQKILQGTPMANNAQDFYNAGRQYGIDPAFLVGIAGAEQSFSPFHNNCCGITGEGDDGSVQGFAAYSSMKVGIYAEARLIAGSLYVKDGLVTIEQIWHRWAPGQAANDPNGLNSNWAKNVIDTMTRLKSL